MDFKNKFKRNGNGNVFLFHNRNEEQERVTFYKKKFPNTVSYIIV